MASLSTWLDAKLAAGSVKPHRQIQPPALNTRWLQTPAGTIRVFDSGGDKPCVVMAPDGPNVLEHYQGLFALLAPQVRVVCFDMPGFGFSAPSAAYDHSLEQGAAAILSVLDQLNIAKATLALSCANGFYAMRVAQRAASRRQSFVVTNAIGRSHAPLDRAGRATAFDVARAGAGGESGISAKNGGVLVPHCITQDDRRRAI
ncbi:alpha/beta hydrolase [Polaromonas sp. P1(28)-13]|nr:alpha/beta hydrolase [Polaromonas sp. P1(28)-13]